MILESLIYEWISLFLRWAHVIAALAWIGASFYLISWENKFNRVKNLRMGVEGDFWTIQGGDFYYVEKLKGAPAKIPDQLHWFKYEAYLTWLSGIALMTVFYYTDASMMMLSPQSPLQTPLQAVAASILSLILVWVLYALYCKTLLARKLRFSAAIGVVCISLLSLCIATCLTAALLFYISALPWPR